MGTNCNLFLLLPHLQHPSGAQRDHTRTNGSRDGVRLALEITISSSLLHSPPQLNTHRPLLLLQSPNSHFQITLHHHFSLSTRSVRMYPTGFTPHQGTWLPSIVKQAKAEQASCYAHFLCTAERQRTK